MDVTQQRHLLSATLMGGTVPDPAWTWAIVADVSWAFTSAKQKSFL